MDPRPHTNLPPHARQIHGPDYPSDEPVVLDAEPTPEPNSDLAQPNREGSNTLFEPPHPTARWRRISDDES